MSFQPILPFGGISGWEFLKRTAPAQQEAFSKSSVMSRETSYFLENIGKVKTADQLLEDRTLRKVALGAYGLDADIDNRYFMKRVLEDSTLDPDALANRLADKRYLEFARAFGFGDSPVPNTVRTNFGTDMVKAYQERQFEISLGAQSEDMRLAFALDREIADVANSGSSDDVKWYTVMGNPPLRRVFETALGLPSSFVGLDLDKQRDILSEKLEKALGDGSVSQFKDPEKLEELVRLFLVRSELNAGPSASIRGSAALTLLTQANNGGFFGGNVLLQTLG